MLTFLYVLCIILIVGAQAGDYWSTKRGLGVPGVAESNPIVRKLGLLPLKLVFTGLMLFASYQSFWVGGHYALTLVICGALAGFYAWVIKHNVDVVNKAKAK
jgi:hypothetical protein